jgi:hypothetical protein
VNKQEFSASIWRSNQGLNLVFVGKFLALSSLSTDITNCGIDFLAVSITDLLRYNDTVPKSVTLVKKFTITFTKFTIVPLYQQEVLKYSTSAAISLKMCSFVKVHQDNPQSYIKSRTRPGHK